jgi:hypothetical protein
MSAFLGLEPIHEQDQIVGHGAKRTDFFTFMCNGAGNDVLFMNVKYAHMTVNDVHS